jgi:hypothetical protein
MLEFRYSSTIFYLGTRWRGVVSFTLRRFTLGERALGAHWIGGWMGPRAVWMLSRRDISLAPTGNRTPAVQPVASRYTDWAIPTVCVKWDLVINRSFAVLYSKCLTTTNLCKQCANNVREINHFTTYFVMLCQSVRFTVDNSIISLFLQFFYYILIFLPVDEWKVFTTFKYKIWIFQ